jgi:hypothetical protein
MESIPRTPLPERHRNSGVVISICRQYDRRLTNEEKRRNRGVHHRSTRRNDPSEQRRFVHLRRDAIVMKAGVASVITARDTRAQRRDHGLHAPHPRRELRFDIHFSALRCGREMMTALCRRAWRAALDVTAGWWPQQKPGNTPLVGRRMTAIVISLG